MRHFCVLSYTLSGIRVHTLELFPSLSPHHNGCRAIAKNAEVFDKDPDDVVYMRSPRFEKVYKTALRSSGLNYLQTDKSINCVRY